MEAGHAVDDMIDKVIEDDLPGNEDEEELSVCAICDNGGEILRCEGDCLRSFHPTVEAASIAGSKCKSLGLSNEQVEAIPVFYCKNCLYKRHQCFACGELGSSDKSSGTEPSCTIVRVRSKQRSFSKRFLLGRPLCVLPISVLSAEAQKFVKFPNCSLLSVNGVQSHTTGNACQRTLDLEGLGTIYCPIIGY